MAVIGHAKSGKTTVVVKLVVELRRRGHRVMTVKHGHAFDVDREGSDSWRHRHDGGAERTVMAGPDGFAMVGAWPDGEPTLLQLAARWLADADVVVAEGFKREPVARIEVFRRAAQPEPVYPPGSAGAAGLLALVADAAGRPAGARVPVLDADDPDLAARLADLVEREVMGLGGGARGA